MAGFAELALHEIAAVEIARDGRFYADISAIGGALFDGSASLGMVVSVAATGTMGTAHQDHLTALVTEPAVGTFEVSGNAAGSVVANIVAMQGWLWSQVGAGSWAVSSQATGDLTFTALAEPVSDEIWGFGTWAWSGGADGGAYAYAPATATVAFDHAVSATALHNAAGASTWTWAGVSRLSAVCSSAPWGQAAFAGVARGAASAAIDAAGAWSFGGAPRLTGVASASPQAQLRFTGTGAMDTRTAWPFAGAAQLRFTGPARMAATAYGRGEGTAHFDGLADISRVTDFDAVGLWGWIGDGRPGGLLYARLPLAHTTFDVPPQPEAWVVPEDIELGEV